MKISVPEGMHVIFSKDDKRVNISFPKQNQQINIYGLDHGDYKSILEMKKLF